MLAAVIYCDHPRERDGESHRDRGERGKKTLMGLERAFRHMSAAVFQALRAVPRLVERNTVPVKPLEVPTYSASHFTKDLA